MVEAQNQQRDTFKQMIKQQQDQQKQMHDMQSLLMLQQQQQTTALMKIIETLVPKWTFSFNPLRSQFTFIVVIALSLSGLQSKSNTWVV